MRRKCLLLLIALIVISICGCKDENNATNNDNKNNNDSNMVLETTTDSSKHETEGETVSSKEQHESTSSSVAHPESSEPVTSQFTFRYAGNGSEAWITGWSGNATDIVLPTKTEWDTPVISVEKNTFSNCTTLNTIYIPNSLFVNTAAFTGCSNLTAVNVEDGNKHIRSIDGVLFENNTLVYYPPNKADRTYIIPEGITSVSKDAFVGSRNIKTLVYPSTMTEIDLTTLNDNTSIENVEIPANATKVYGDIYGEGNGIAVYNINVSESNQTYSSINGILLSKDKTKLILFPRKRTEVEIPDTVREISSFSFCGCNYITSITIPENVTKIDKWAFYRCKDLDSVTIKPGTVSIEQCAFAMCPALKRIYIPDSVTNIGSFAIGYHAVYNSECFGKYSDLVICGREGSAAEKYAKDNDFKFEKIY
ncbi:MAG: leucine-rich repeat protein [Lachnospira sp.]